MSSERDAQDLLDRFREKFGYSYCALNAYSGTREYWQTIMLNVCPTDEQREALTSLRFHAWFCKTIAPLSLPRQVLYTRTLANIMSASHALPFELDLRNRSAEVAYLILVHAEHYAIN